MIYHRKPNRLGTWDYSQNGGYFLTICAKKHEKLFGTVVGDGVLDVPHVALSGFGEIIEKRIQAMDMTYDDVVVEKYVIMPNHLHLLLRVEQTEPKIEGEGTSRTPSPTNAVIPRFVSTLKRMCNQNAGFSMFQRSYHDHVIRNEADYLRIWNYIDTNPQRWDKDCFFVT